MVKDDSVMNKIEKMRRLMVDTAVDEGLSSTESVEISQKLDALLNEVQNKETT